jgi:hypothetical protein
MVYCKILPFKASELELKREDGHYGHSFIDGVSHHGELGVIGRVLNLQSSSALLRPSFEV